MVYSNEIASIESIQSMIFNFRGTQVMIDRDLAQVYGVENKRLNEQVKRNISRFPKEFRFQLDDSEKKQLVADCDRFASLKYSSSNPYAFTEQGVSMLAAVLHSETAIKISIKIINTFVEMRQLIQNNASFLARVDSLERHQIIFESETEKNFDKIFQALEQPEKIPKGRIFFEGQTYDAYSFICNIVRKAKKSLILIDNYVDDTVLTLFSKRSAGVACSIYTKKISQELKLDLEKHNQQYDPISIKPFQDSHDRFLIIDEAEIYHIGASLKDLGKGWFALSKFESDTMEMLRKLRGKK